jgi:histidinol phosphatase-like PHP family hydrolase
MEMASMIDLHTHSLLSDGVLIPTELIRRAATIGYRYIGLTDHADAALLDFTIPRAIQACRSTAGEWGIVAIPGIELTHLPTREIAPMTRRARRLGACLVVMHGETIVEPVPPGTNRAAIEAGVDILAHPGLIDEETAAAAAAAGVLLEVTTRRGHAYANGHVVGMARRTGALMIINTDSHEPGDLTGRDRATVIGRGAGMTDQEIERAFGNAERLADVCLTRMKESVDGSEKSLS